MDLRTRLSIILCLVSRVLAAPAEINPASENFDIETFAVETSSFDDVPVVPLAPIISGSDLQKRRDRLGLRNNLRLEWGNADASAKLECDFNGDDEHVINMEDFGDVLENVDCTPPQLSLDFKDKSSFEDAIRQWNWVNERDARQFVMIVNHKGCGPSHVRKPYRIRNVRYDKKKFIAYLDAAETRYKDIIRDGHIRIETIGNEAAPATAELTANTTKRWTNPAWHNSKRRWETPKFHNLTRRGAHTTDISRRASVSKSVSLAKDFSGNIWKQESGNNKAQLDAIGCGTTGTVKVALDVSIKLLSIKRAYLEFKADNVGASLGLALSGHLETAYKDTKELFRISAVGFEIPEIARLSLGPAFGVGWSASLKGDGKVSWGAGVKLTPDSRAVLCLKGCDSSSSGFKVSYDKKEPTAAGNLTADLQIYGYVTLSGGASLFDKKYEAGVAVLAPQFKGNFATQVTTAGGVCGNPASKFGVDAKLDVGIEAYGYIGKNYQSPDKKFSILKEESSLYKQCFGLKRRDLDG